MTTAPYKSPAVFDETTLPQKLRRAHNTKAGVWAVIRVLEGQVRYVIEETGAATILTNERPGLAQPEQFHHVEPLGPMKTRVDFYDQAPDL
jgi:hemoglobin